MPLQPFQPEDLNRIDRILRHFPEVDDVLRTVKQISEQTRFPINSFDELMESMGGQDASIMFQGQPYRLADLRHAIPTYYFPIGSEDDLIAKVVDLRLQERPISPASLGEQNIEWGTQVDELAEGVGEPPKIDPASLQWEKGVPGVMGFGKPD